MDRTFLKMWADPSKAVCWIIIIIIITIIIIIIHTILQLSFANII